MEEAMKSIRGVSGLGIGLLAILAFVLGSAGCGESCEDQAQAACKQFFNEDVGDGSEYDTCYLQALAKCGHSG